MASRRRLPWLLTAAVIALSAPALADPTPQQKELARDLMHKGYEARSAHDLKLALESFKGADDIMHVPTTKFEVARSEAELGLLVEAHETLLALMRSPETPGESQAFREARGYAKVLDGQVAPRIPQIRIHVTGATTDQAIAVSVDGTALPEGALLVPYKVDPGHHVIAATTAGASGRAEIDVAERDSKDVTVPLVASPAATAATAAPPAAPEAATAANANTTTSASPASVAEQPASAHGLGPVAWTGFGVAAAGLVVGTVTGILTLSDASSLESKCNGNRCPPSTYDLMSSSNTLATVSTVSFIVAGAGAAVGLGAWLLGRGHDEAPATTGGLRVTPWIGLGAAGARGTF